MRLKSTSKSREFRSGSRQPTQYVAPDLFRRSSFEPLEERVLLSAAPLAGLSSGAWFAQLHPSADLATASDVDRWIVRLSDEALSGARTVAEAASLLPASDFDVKVVRGLGLPGQLLLETSAASQDRVTAWLGTMSSIAYFQADTKLRGQLAPNDPGYGAQIGLHNTAQAGGVFGADISAPQAWELTTGSSDVVVAVIDSGIDYLHSDLADNIWTNPGEIAGDGLDNDQNGKVDDVYGYDFVNGSAIVQDDNGHGTHVAGIIGAQGNNGIGIAGVAWHTSLMNLKYLDSNLEGLTSNAIEAVNYVTFQRVHNGVNVRVINASWGDATSSPALEDAIRAAGNAGILVVAAAGNGDALSHGLNLDYDNGFFPASFDLPNVISVGASTPADSLAGFSNYGAAAVDVVAPGVGIYSTKPDNSYGTLNGTSMAAPHVAGVAALVFAYKPYATVDEVRSAILQGADPIAELTGKVLSGARLNAYGALTASTFAPTGTLTAAENIESATMDDHTLVITYSGDSALDTASIANSNLSVSRIGFGSTEMAVTLQNLVQLDDFHIVATYALAPPIGIRDPADNTTHQGWDATDNGTYEVYLGEGEVRDVLGLASHKRLLGTFLVSIFDASVFFVNTTSDSTTGTISHGLPSDSTLFPSSSLRAAILAADAMPGPNTIVLPEGIYTLTLAGAGEDASLTGDLDISDATGPLTILGGGAPYSVITAAGLDRVIDVRPGAVLHVSRVTLSGGAGQFGAGLRNAGFTSLTLTTVANNTASHTGGGIYNSAQLEVFQSTISHNATTEQLAAGGGGLFNNGTATIQSSTFSDNVTAAGLLGGNGGGAIFNDGPGVINVVNSTLSGNSATVGGGGAIYSRGTLNLTNDTIVENRAAFGSGGGVYNEMGSTAPIAYQNSFGSNGPALGALDNPEGIVVDASGNIYVADTNNHRIQVFNSEGFVIRAFGGYGQNVGQFDRPTLLAWDASGYLYVLDEQNRRVQVFDQLGTYQRTLGSPLLFERPTGMTIEGEQLYVTDLNGRVTILSLAGSLLTVFDVYSNSSSISGASDIDVDAAGLIYVVDIWNSAINVFNEFGILLLEIGNQGPPSERINYPEAIRIGADGNVYVLEANDEEIKIYSATGAYIASHAVVDSKAFTLGSDNAIYLANSDGIHIYSAGPTVYMGRPEANDFTRSLAVDPTGNIYVADTQNNRIQVFNSALTLTGQFGLGGTLAGQLNAPEGIAVNSAGNIIVADTQNNRVQVFSNSGTLLFAFGSPGSGNGQFQRPVAVAHASDNSLVVADRENHRIQVFDGAGNFLRKFDAGVGEPASVAIDSQGLIYVSDDASNLVKVFTLLGVFVTSFGGSGSGPGQFSSPAGIAFDAEGNVFVADRDNNRVQVFDSGHSYLYHFGALGSSGGKFVSPLGLAIDPTGNIYVSEVGNDRNQHFTPAAAATRTINLVNTIIAANSSQSEPNVVGAFNSLGHNLIGSVGFSASGFSGILGDLVGSLQTPLNPQLGPLDNNGGPTQTHAPLTTSLAIDGGDNAYMPAKDQRGRLRPQQVNTSTPPRVDIGAIERADSIVRGRVFNDRNGNGQLDANESGLGGWTVYVDSNNNRRLDVGEPNTVTAFDDPATPLSVETGQYALSSMAGDYRIRVVAPSTYTITSPSRIASDSAISIEQWLYDPVQDQVHQVFAPALDQGRVAFWGHANSGGLGLYTLSPTQGLQLVRHISDPGGYFGVGSDVTFEDGIVAYNGIASLPTGVYLTRPDGTHLTVADGSTPIPNSVGTFAGFSTPHVSDGLAVFSAGGNNGRIYLGNGTGALTSLADEYMEFGGQPTSYLDITDVAFDGSSYVFKAETFQNDQYLSRIYKGTSGGITTIADRTTPVPGGTGNFTSFVGYNGIATYGGNAFFMALGADRTGVYAGSAPDNLHVVADTTTPIPQGTGTFTWFSSFSAGGGIYAFLGYGQDGQRGVYAEIDGVLKRIVDLNTPLFEGLLGPEYPATGLLLGPDAVDGNQIAFLAYRGGWSAIFVATLSLENAHTLSVGVGAELSGINFGAQPFPGSIQGTVYNDLDRNGVRDLSDPPVAGRVVFLDQNNNGTLDALEISAVTDALGQYMFAGLEPLTTYRVVEQVPSGWSVTAPTTARWTVPLSPGQTVVNNDFGNFQGSTSGGAGNASMLRGKLFVDTNSNGVQDVGEVGLAGITVFLDANGNGALDPTELSTVTAAGDASTTGNYSFSSLGAGAYNVRLATPSGYLQTSPIGNTLTALSPRSTGVQPQQGAIGDFNLDGYPDLVVPNSGSNELSIFVNDGFGAVNLSGTIQFGFPPGASSGSPLVGFAPSFTAVADFDNDGKPDVAVPNTNSNNVAILRNTTSLGASPSFSISTLPTPANGPIGIAVADFNQDGYADLAVTEEYGATGGSVGKVAIYLNNGVASPGTFTLLSDISVGRFAVYVSPIQTNDDNGDGQIDGTDYVDLAVANYRDNTITILKNNGSGNFIQFGAPLSVGSQPASIATADFNHDGKPDLAVANLISTSISVLFGQGNSTFAAAQTYPISGTANAASLVATDLDNDGNVDLAVSTGASGDQARVRIFHNRGDGIFVPLVDKSVGSGTLNTLQAVFIVAADLDHDTQSTNDLVVINGYSNRITVLKNSLVQGTYQTTIGDPETVTNLSFGILPTSNAAPTFVAGGDRTVLEDSGPQTVTGWATGISTGAPSESSQTLNFIVSNSNTSLFSSQPTISSNGTLTYTPAANANGSATVYVLLHDNGGTANGGVDTSPLVTFTITVTPVNDRPSFIAGANRTVLEDVGPQTVAPWAVFISKGPLNEASQTLTFLVTNDNNALFAAQPSLDSNGTLTFTPATNANGVATVTVILQDTGGTLNGGLDTSIARTFTITVSSVNDAPVRLAGSLSNLTVAANSGDTSLGLVALSYGPGGGIAEASQTLTYTITSVPPPSLGNIVLADGVTVVNVSASYSLNDLRQMRFKATTGGIGGSEVFSFQVQDSGGTANGGVDLITESMTITVTAPFSSVVGRHLFYNQSGTAAPLRYDGNNTAINANDDLAIATNKTAYLPGTGASTFANVSSYTKGINGIMVDIAGTHGTITAADFIFRVGNNNTPNSWVAAPAPSSISVRAGAGVSGSDRVVLTWANGAISKKWLEVIVLANANTGLSQKAGYPVGQGDVFFFGNAVANSGAGDNATQSIVNVTDELGARNNPATLASNIPITNLYDYNRDGQVNVTDALAARNNPTSTGNVVRYISVANPPTAPEASPASDTGSDDGGVASALSAPSAAGALASAGVPRWLVNRLQNVDLNSDPIARFFEHLAEQNTPGTRKILVAADNVADRLGLDDSLLDSLLADLGLD